MEKKVANIASQPRALGLCSGGLDSILAALILKQQAIHVEWITFETPFFTAEKARKAAVQTGICLHVHDITDIYLEMMKDPPAGFGKNMNPCMDCHSLMFRSAGRIMQDNGFDFLFSGEVLGQRPMSQTLSALHYVAKHSGFGDFILRPLSAKRLNITPMEQKGLVDRERLLDLSGRSRKSQMQLAEQFGIKDYPSPAGGCLLTDPAYSRRLKDLFDHQPDFTLSDLYLLKHGRHMRLGPECKIIVGRTKADNDEIRNQCDPQRDAIIKIRNHPGPTVVIPSSASKEMVYLAAAICAGYSKAPEMTPSQAQITLVDKTDSITVLPILPDEAKKFLIK